MWNLDILARSALPVGLVLVIVIGSLSLLAASYRNSSSLRPVCHRLLLPLIAVLTALIIGMVTLTWQLHNQQLAETKDLRQSSIASEFSTALEHQGLGLAATTQTIANDERMRLALAKANTDQMIADWLPWMEHLKSVNKITHFYFHTPDLRCLLRLHSLARRGDRVQRFSLHEAERTGKPFTGLEVGQQGTFTMRSVAPVRSGDKLLGYVELGKEVEDVLLALHHRTGHHVAVTVQKRYLIQPQWQDSMRHLGRDPDWDRLPDSVVVYASQGRLPDPFLAVLDEHPVGPSPLNNHKNIVFSGLNWQVSRSLLHDASGTAVGHLLVMSDITEEIASFQRLMILASATGVIVLAGLIGFIYILLRRTDAGILTQQQALRKANRKMEEAMTRANLASEAKSQFLATMSHEIRTPMNGVIGMTSLLLLSNLDREQRHQAETIRNSSEALLDIINDILDFSKLEAGKLEFERIECKPLEIIEGVLDIVAPRLKNSDIDLACQIQPNAEGPFLSDPGRLRQVLLNLVSNAVKFTKQGSVTISATASRLPSGDWRFDVRVTDTGIGIPPEARERLFQSFSQAEVSTARRFGGSGLGLAICKRIVEGMGGEIGCESREGEGSTFWFTLPMTKVERHDIEKDSSKPLTGQRVLNVGGSVVATAAITKQLETWGVNCVAMATVMEALAALRAAKAQGQAFHTVIAWHPLKGMTGFDLFAVLRGDEGFADTQMIIACRSHGADARTRSMALKNVGILERALHPSELRAALLGMNTVASPNSSTVSVLPLVPAQTRPVPWRVLVVEDNLINQQVARGLLASLGHHAEIANNGSEAVEVAKKEVWDIIFMDLQMPGMDGREATRLIRALPGPTGRALIIAMTANAMANDRESCLAAGMDDHLGKPVDRERLQTLLERWLPQLEKQRRNISTALEELNI